MGIKHGSVVIGIEDFHDGHCCGGGAFPVQVGSLDGQCVLRDFLGRREEWRPLRVRPWENAEGGRMLLPLTEFS